LDDSPARERLRHSPTYIGKSGRQFVVIAAGGGNKYDKVFTGKIVAFALPKSEAKAK
jgi:glucose dehydrogenase